MPSALRPTLTVDRDHLRHTGHIRRGRRMPEVRSICPSIAGTCRASAPGGWRLRSSNLDMAMSDEMREHGASAEPCPGLDVLSMAMSLRLALVPTVLCFASGCAWTTRPSIPALSEDGSEAGADGESETIAEWDLPLSALEQRLWRAAVSPQQDARAIFVSQEAVLRTASGETLPLRTRGRRTWQVVTGPLVPTHDTWVLRVESEVALVARIDPSEPGIVATRPETLVRPVSQVEPGVGLTLPAGVMFDTEQLRAARGMLPAASMFGGVRIRGVIDLRGLDSGYVLANDREPLVVTHSLRGPFELLAEPGGEVFASVDALEWDVTVHEHQQSWALVTVAQGTCADFRVDGWVSTDALEPMPAFNVYPEWPTGLDPFADAVEAKPGDWLVADTGGRVGLVVQRRWMDCTGCMAADPITEVKVHLLGEEMALRLVRGDTESRKTAREVRDPFVCRRPIVPGPGIPVIRFK